MEMSRSRRGFILSTGLAFASGLAFSAGCGSGSSGSAPAAISPEAEKQVQDMLKNKSHDYNERYKKKGGRR
jgi:hypothetical protein